MFGLSARRLVSHAYAHFTAVFEKLVVGEFGQCTPRTWLCVFSNTH